MKTKITIISGGTGSNNLIKGLMYLGKDNIQITNVINLYDDGKSTGICREIFNCLGPSDLRKVQFSQLKQSNNDIYDFFNSRVFISIENIEDLLFDIIDNLIGYCQKTDFYDCIPFAIHKIKKYWKKHNIESFKSFNLANIFYSTMFVTRGIEDTIKYFKKFFGIKHNVVINSYTNSELYAKLENSKTLLSEGDIVSINDKTKSIEKLILTNTPKINKYALYAIEEAQVIIISSGTPYSSIIPTFLDNNLTHAINKTCAIKYIVGNTKFDGDSYNLTLDKIFKLYGQYIDLSQFKLIINTDADDDFYIENKVNEISCAEFIKNSYSTTTHNPNLLANDIFCDWLQMNQILKSDNKLVFDFDGTLYHKKYIEKSYDNIIKLHNISKILNTEINSGNSIQHIKEKDTNSFLSNIPIWANGSCDKYLNYEYAFSCCQNILPKKLVQKLIEYCESNSLLFDIRGQFCFSIKCLFNNRNTIENDEVLKEICNYSNLSINRNGETTLDIISDNKNKNRNYSTDELDHIVYFGDSPNGNDKYMFDNVENSYYVNIYGMNLILSIILYNIENK